MKVRTLILTLAVLGAISLGAAKFTQHTNTVTAAKPNLTAKSTIGGFAAEDK